MPVYTKGASKVRMKAPGNHMIARKVENQGARVLDRPARKDGGRGEGWWTELLACA